jgi:hypothetical protein
LEDEELVDLKDQFEAIDVEHRGTITLEELKKVREAVASLFCRDETETGFLSVWPLLNAQCRLAIEHRRVSNSRRVV